MILQRLHTDETGTYGILIDEHPWLVTLEPVAPIQAGTYTCVRYQSPKFHREVFEIQSVPGKTNVELHLGNTIHDTEGCVLVGMQCGVTNQGYGIIQSLLALNALMTRMHEINAFELVIREGRA